MCVLQATVINFGSRYQLHWLKITAIFFSRSGKMLEYHLN